jgi:tellurite methyltransferase
MEPPKPFWETAYQIPTGSAFGKPSEEIVELSNELSPGSAVLDLGCGEGRNALFLAARGLDVTAVDISEHGISKLKTLARKMGLAVNAHVADMRSFQLDRSFQLIISHGCLHLIERQEWARLLERIKDHTADGGYNDIVVFTDRLEPPADLGPFCKGLFFEGELFQNYSDWDIRLEKAYTINDEHPGGIRHTHPINKVVACKPTARASP